MIPLLRRVTLILLCPALACSVLGACAADGDGPRPDDGRPGRGGPQRPLPNVFISLAGEPFRAPGGAPYPVAAWFAHADADHDGRLTRAEADADALKFFERLDTNHDGVIDGLELQDYEQSVAPEILPRIESLRSMEGMDPSLTFGDPDPNAPGGRRRGMAEAKQPEAPRGIGTQGAAVYSLVNTPEPVAAADTELDGRITRAEFAAAVDRRFDALDKTGVGYLTLAGLPKTPVQTEILKRQAKARKAHGDRPAGPPPS